MPYDLFGKKSFKINTSMIISSVLNQWIHIHDGRVINELIERNLCCLFSKAINAFFFIGTKKKKKGLVFYKRYNIHNQVVFL